MNYACKCVFSLLISLFYVSYCNGAQRSLNSNYGSQDFIRLTKIPRQFQVRGANPGEKIDQYIHEIEGLAKQRNITVRYKVSVETSERKERKKKKYIKKSKTYSVPLKIRGSKVSSLEHLLKQRKDERRAAKEIVRIPSTTEFSPPIYSTKRNPSGKYKPIINKVKTNFQKRIKPVKTSIIKL